MTGLRRNAILFVVNGMGLGNSTRISAILDSLSPSIHVEIATFGNGLLFFSHRFPGMRVHKIHGCEYYGYKNWRKFRIPFLAIRFIWNGFRNGLILSRILYRSKPSIVVYDSIYNIFPRMLSSSTFVSINNSNEIVFSRASSAEMKRWPHFFIETFDYWFHRWIPHYVISPWFSGELRKRPSKKWRNVGLIVRREFSSTAKAILPQEGAERCLRKRIVVLLSGAVIANRSFVDDLAQSSTYQIDVFGEVSNAKNLSNLCFLGKSFENSQAMWSADLIICNGGFSSISEALSLRKPFVVLPLPKHYEQWVTARTLESLGVAIVASEVNVVACVAKVFASYETYLARIEGLEFDGSGAEQTGNVLSELIAGKNGNSPTRHFNQTNPSLPARCQRYFLTGPYLVAGAERHATILRSNATKDHAVSPRIRSPKTLEDHPHIRATRLHRKLKDRRFTGSMSILRQRLREIRPRQKARLPVRSSRENRRKLTKNGSNGSYDQRRFVPIRLHNGY